MFKTGSTDLDVDAPERVAEVLRTVADKFRESVDELSSAWQDKEAGRVWGKLATILDRAAASAEKVVRS